MSNWKNQPAEDYVNTKAWVMKFLLMAIRYVFIHLGVLKKEEANKQVVDRRNFIHPAEFRTR